MPTLPHIIKKNVESFLSQLCADPLPARAAKGSCIFHNDDIEAAKSEIRRQIWEMKNKSGIDNTALESTDIVFTEVEKDKDFCRLEVVLTASIARFARDYFADQRDDCWLRR